MPTINKNNTIKQDSVKYQSDESIGSQYYNTSIWHSLRDWYIKHHPFCEICEQKGITRLADQVHHKVKFLTGKTHQDRMKLLTDVNNLQSVCRDCHNEIHHGKKNNDIEGDKDKQD